MLDWLTRVLLHPASDKPLLGTDEASGVSDASSLEALVAQRQAAERRLEDLERQARLGAAVRAVRRGPG